MLRLHQSTIRRFKWLAAGAQNLLNADTATAPNHRGGATVVEVLRHHLHHISIHAPAGGRHCAVENAAGTAVFQSTHPQGVRQLISYYLLFSHLASIMREYIILEYIIIGLIYLVILVT